MSTERSSGRVAATTADAGNAARSGWTRGARMALAVVVLAGLAVRLAMISLAPAHAFLWDHIDLMVWSDWAFENGPTALYDLPPHRLINVSLPEPLARRGTVEAYPSLNAYNYPPLWGYAAWLSGGLWHLLDRHVVTTQVRPEIAEFAGFAGTAVTSRVANTVAARAANAALPAVADFLLAWGVLMLVRALRRGRPPGWAEVTAFALALCGPPFFLVSAYWTQTDACPSGALVWGMYFLIVARPWRAGACIGAAVMLKASALLVAPVLVFVFVALLLIKDGAVRRAAMLWKTVAAALIVVAVTAGPYAIADRHHPEGGWLRWYRRAVSAPLVEQFPYTTLKAFNIWWLDFLLHKQQAAALEPEARIWPGLTKTQAGHVALVLASVAAAALAAWRWRWGPEGWVAFAFLFMLAAFVFPTRVHERYILYCLPYVVAVTVVFRRWIPVLAALLLVSTFEVTWYLWLSAPDAPIESPAGSPDAAVWSLVLAVVTLMSFLYALGALLPWSSGSATATSPIEETGRSNSLFARSPGAGQSSSTPSRGD